MKFNGFLANNELFITYNGKAIMNNIKFKMNFPHSCDRVTEYLPCEIGHFENGFTVKLHRNPPRDWVPETGECSVTFKEIDETLCMYIDFSANLKVGYHNYSFDAFESAKMLFDVPKDCDGTMCLHTENPYWMRPDFRPIKDVYGAIDSVYLNFEETHINMLPVYSENFACEFRNEGLIINTRVSGLTKLCGTVMSIAASDDPLSVTHKNTLAMRNRGVINVPTREERPYPEQLQGFGWCTWNAFYHEVTAEKIIQKMEEFKEKNVIPRWVLIDDGWSQTSDGFLQSFEVDRVKFPNGLKALVDEVKSYGVKYVGVWHAVGGYWDGIDKNSDLYKNNRDMFFEIPCGFVYPGMTEESAFAFYDKWYTYLSGEGIDFVKVDNQGSLVTKFDYKIRGVGGTANIASALDKAVKKHFDGAIINCMGATLENMLCRPLSLINRNSDDFYPNKPEDFSLHTIQNVYTAVLQREFHNCDFDMFFSKHYTAVGSAVIRALSGGPVYVSDEIGNTDESVLSHLCDERGNLVYFDNFAVPTKDCFYTDCAKESKVLKTYNVKGKNIVFGYFGVTPEKIAYGEFKLSDVCAENEKYLAHDYFADKYFVMDKDTSVPLKSDYNGYGLITLYPISADGTVSVGDKRFYAEGATAAVKTCDYKELLN